MIDSRLLSAAFVIRVIQLGLVASLATACGMTRVFLNGVDDEPGGRVTTAHPQVAVRAADIDVQVEGQILTVIDLDEVEVEVADRLRENLGAKAQGPRGLPTVVRIVTPELDSLPTFGSDPIKSVSLEFTSTLPDGREVKSEQAPRYLDGESGLGSRNMESMVYPTTFGALLFGVVGSGVAANMFAWSAYAVLENADNARDLVDTVRTAPPDAYPLFFAMGGLVLGTVALPMLLGLTVFGATIGAAGAMIWIQSGRMEEVLSDGIRTHAHAVASALEQGPPLATAKAKHDAPDKEEDAPDEKASLLEGPPPPASAGWRVEVNDEGGCVDTETLRRELDAWVAPAAGQPYVVRAHSHRLAEDHVRVRVVVEHPDSMLVVADKEVVVLRADCGEVERLVVQSLRRQMP